MAWQYVEGAGELRRCASLCPPHNGLRMVGARSPLGQRASRLLSHRLHFTSCGCFTRSAFLRYPSASPTDTCPRTAAAPKETRPRTKVSWTSEMPNVVVRRRVSGYDTLEFGYRTVLGQIFGVVLQLNVSNLRIACLENRLSTSRTNSTQTAKWMSQYLFIFRTGGDR